jgi:hypothetical protein
VDEFQGVFETPEGIWKFGVNQENFHLDAILSMTLEDTLKEGLELLARCFLVSQLGSDLPVAEPFATFTDDEAIIGAQTFCRILNDRVSGYFPLTVWACDCMIHCSSLNECLPGGAHLLSASLKRIAYWAGMLVPLADNAA